MVRKGERGSRSDRHGDVRPTRVADQLVTPERATPALDHRQRHPILAALVDCYPEAAVGVDADHRVLVANSRIGELLEIDPESLIDAEPGDALLSGRTGAAGTLLEYLTGRDLQPQDCRLRRRVEDRMEHLDLQFTATPLSLDTGDFTLVSVRDTTDEKRRRVLERFFFHDVINVAGGLQGLTGLFEDSEGDEAIEIQREVHALAVQLVEEIQAHRDLVAAECGDLQAHFDEVDVQSLLMRLCTAYAHHHVADGKRIEVGSIQGNAKMHTDELLLRRALGNLVKNALEAIRTGEAVTVRYDGTNASMRRFEVHNPGVMPADARMRMFQRSFTTKEGAGRGVGSYSVKLFVERHLGGKVDFVSDEEHGTIFRIELPER